MSIRRSRRTVSSGASATAPIPTSAAVTTDAGASVTTASRSGRVSPSRSFIVQLTTPTPAAMPSMVATIPMMRLSIIATSKARAHRHAEREQRRELPPALVHGDAGRVERHQKREEQGHRLVTVITSVNSSTACSTSRVSAATGCTDATAHARRGALNGGLRDSRCRRDRKTVHPALEAQQSRLRGGPCRRRSRSGLGCVDRHPRGDLVERRRTATTGCRRRRVSPTSSPRSRAAFRAITIPSLPRRNEPAPRVGVQMRLPASMNPTATSIDFRVRSSAPGCRLRRRRRREGVRSRPRCGRPACEIRPRARPAARGSREASSRDDRPCRGTSRTFRTGRPPLRSPQPGRGSW